MFYTFRRRSDTDYSLLHPVIVYAPSLRDRTLRHIHGSNGSCRTNHVYGLTIGKRLPAEFELESQFLNSVYLELYGKRFINLAGP